MVCDPTGCRRITFLSSRISVDFHVCREWLWFVTQQVVEELLFCLQDLVMSTPANFLNDERIRLPLFSVLETALTIGNESVTANIAVIIESAQSVYTHLINRYNNYPASDGMLL